MKKVLQAIGGFLKRLFAGAKKLIVEGIDPAIMLVEGLKKFIDGPIAPVIAQLIPGTWDDMLIARIRVILPEVLRVLGLIKSAKSITEKEALREALVSLSQMDDQRRSDAYLNIASHVSAKLLSDSGGSVDPEDLKGIVQVHYRREYKQSALLNSYG